MSRLLNILHATGCWVGCRVFRFNRLHVSGFGSGFRIWGLKFQVLFTACHVAFFGPTKIFSYLDLLGVPKRRLTIYFRSVSPMRGHTGRWTIQEWNITIQHSLYIMQTGCSRALARLAPHSLLHRLFSFPLILFLSLSSGSSKIDRLPTLRVIRSVFSSPLGVGIQSYSKIK